MEQLEIIKKVPGYLHKNEKIFSSDYQKLDFVGIISLAGSKIYITDTENVINELFWCDKLDCTFLCSGLVIGIKGEKRMDHGRPVGIFVHEYYFPNPERTIKPLSEHIYVCSRLNEEKIDKICNKIRQKNVYVLSFSAGNQLIEMVNYLIKRPNKFHIMPHIDTDITQKCLPISFQINTKNISSPEIPFIYNNILFVTEWMMQEMMSHTNLSNEKDVLSLIAKSGMVTPCNRILKKNDIAHQAFMIICDTSNSVSSVNMINQTKIVMVSKNDILETDGDEVSFISID